MEDFKTVNEYIKELKGNRTVKEFAKDTGIAIGTAVKYLNGKGKGGYKIDILKRIINEDVRPQANVSLNDLLRALELENDKYARERYIYETEQLDDNMLQHSEDITPGDALVAEETSFGYYNSSFPTRSQYLKDMRAYEMMVEGIIANKIRHNIKFVMLPNDAFNSRDISLSVQNESGIHFWDFDILKIHGNGLRKVKNKIADYLWEYDEEEEKVTKISIIIDDEEVYLRIKDRIDRNGLLPIKRDISVMYYDQSLLDIVGEIYISTKSEESRMFYL